MRLLLLLAFVALPASAQPLRVAGPPEPFLPEGFAHARYAPGGAHLAFTSPDYTGLWVRDETTGAVRQLSAAPGVGFGVAWSQDGGALVAREAEDTPDGRLSTIVLLTPDATRTALTAPRPHVSGLPVWAPDDATVLLPTAQGVERLVTGRVPEPASGAAFVVGPAAEGLWKADAATAARASVPGLPGGAVLAASPSPDGQRVVVHVMGQGLFVVGPEGVVSLGRGEAPAWSPDGRYVAFMQTQDDGYTVTGSDLYVVTPDGATRFLLTPTPTVHEMYPAWTPDGRALLYDDARTRRVMRLPLTEAR